MALKTNEISTCKFSTVPGISYSLMRGTFLRTVSTSHATQLSNLISGNKYTYYVRCSDSFGNVNTMDYVITFNVAASELPCDISATNAMNITKLIAQAPTKADGKITKICFAPGDYKENIVISGKSNLILKAQGEGVRFIEPNPDLSIDAVYTGVALDIVNSKNIILDGMSIINIHNYPPDASEQFGLYHKVTRALFIRQGSVNISARNVVINASGKQGGIARESSTLKIIDSNVTGYYFVLCSETGSTISTERTRYARKTDGWADTHAFFWVDYGDLIFKDSTFVFGLSGGFIGGVNTPNKNFVIVKNATVEESAGCVNWVGSSENSCKLWNIIAQHPGYYGITLYWLSSLPDLRVDPPYNYFGNFHFIPWKDPVQGSGTSPYVKLCLPSSSSTKVTCTECITPVGTYTEAFSTQAEYDAYFSNYCKTFEEPKPAY